VTKTEGRGTRLTEGGFELPDGATESTLKKFGDDYCRIIKTNYEKSVNGYSNVSNVRDGLGCDNPYAVAIKPKPGEQQGHFCILIPTRNVKNVSEKKKITGAGKTGSKGSGKCKKNIELNNPFLARLLEGGVRKTDIRKEFKNCLARLVEVMGKSTNETMPRVDPAVIHLITLSAIRK